MKRKTKTVKASAPVVVVASGVQTFRPEVVKLSEIRPGANHRKHFDAESMGELTASVRQFGIQSPLLVRPLPADQVNGVRFEIVFGERRFRAASDAGLGEVPVMVRDLTDREALEISVLENLQRKDVLATEEADGMAALVAGGDYTAATLAEKLGKSVQHVQGRLRLAKLPQWLRDAVEEGKCDVGVAQLLATVPEDQREEAYSRFCDSPTTWSYREVADRLEQEYRRDLRKAAFPWKSSDCKGCQFRGANVEGFQGSGTMCLNVECYKGQESAHTRLLLMEAGGRHIEPEDWTRERWSGRYIKAEDLCPEDRKNRTYAKLLGKRLAEVSLVTVEAGELVHVLTRAAWKKLAPEVVPGLAEELAKDAELSAKSQAQARAAESHAEARFTASVLRWSGEFGNSLPLPAWQMLARLLSSDRNNWEWLADAYRGAESRDRDGLWRYWQERMVQSGENWAGVCLNLAMGGSPFSFRHDDGLHPEVLGFCRLVELRGAKS